MKFPFLAALCIANSLVGMSPPPPDLDPLACNIDWCDPVSMDRLNDVLGKWHKATMLKRAEKKSAQASNEKSSEVSGKNTFRARAKGYFSCTKRIDD